MVLKFINWPITISLFLLLTFSVSVIFSTSFNLGLQQLIFAIVGIFLYFLISEIDYQTLVNFIKPSYFVIILLLILVFILGIESRGSIRWIPLGIFNIQPSEFAKPVLILVLSFFWAFNRPTWINILKSILLTLPIVFLIFKQPDLGTTITIVALWSFMLFASNISLKKMLTLILLFVFILPVVWLSLHDYQKQRINTFLSPGSDPLQVGYTAIQSIIAVGSGQFLGRGLGYGTQSRLQFLPEYRTDFIFASMAEELGFLGTLIIIIIYLFLIFYSLKVALQAQNYLGYLIAIGVSAVLMFQTVVNIGMNIGLLPITGITLPLISYGGSSLISTLISLGLLASVESHRARIDMR